MLHFPVRVMSPGQIMPSHHLIFSISSNHIFIRVLKGFPQLVLSNLSTRIYHNCFLFSTSISYVFRKKQGQGNSIPPPCPMLSCSIFHPLSDHFILHEMPSYPDILLLFPAVPRCEAADCILLHVPNVTVLRS